MRRVARRRPGHGARDAEVDQLADAVLDVELQPAERLHQRLDVEALLGPRVQIAEESGAQRRLHQRPEPRLEIAGSVGRARRRALARRAVKVRSSTSALPSTAV